MLPTTMSVSGLLPLTQVNIGRSTMIKRIFSLMLMALFLAGTAAAVTGCNTVEGAGKDIEQGGKAIKEEASEHK